MNIFNRMVVVLLILVVLILTVVIVIVPEQSFNLLRAIFEWAHQDTKGYIDSPDHYLFLAARVIIGGAIILVGLLLLWLELRRPRKKVIRVQKMAGGETNIAIESISQRVAYNIDQLPEVIKVTPRVTGRSRGVDIDSSTGNLSRNRRADEDGRGAPGHEGRGRGPDGVEAGQGNDQHQARALSQRIKKEPSRKMQPKGGACGRVRGSILSSL